MTAKCQLTMNTYLQARLIITHSRQLNRLNCHKNKRSVSDSLDNYMKNRFSAKK